jgi:hypothetical protein
MGQAGEIVFPTDPKIGDIFIAPNGKAFQWDGDSWEVIQLPPDWKDVRNKPENFPPPIASKDTLGGIKVGRNLSIDKDGTLNGEGGEGGSPDWADIKNKPLEFPPVIASVDRVGGVKPGRNVFIDRDGTINATGGGGGGADGIASWERLPPDTLYPPAALVGMSQGYEDVALTADELFGTMLNNSTMQKVVDGTGQFYQIFPGKNGVSLALQVVKVITDATALNTTQGVQVKLLLPLTDNPKFTDAFQASATLEANRGGNIPINGWTVTATLTPTRDAIVLKAIQTSTITSIPIRVAIWGFVKTPVYPVPMPPPPVITRAIPMNGGFRFFFKPQAGTFIENVETWGFESSTKGATFIAEVGYSWRFIQIGVDDEYEPDDLLFYNQAWRKKFGPDNLGTGKFENGKPVTWKPYTNSKQQRMSPYGQSVTVTPSDKAPLHSPNVLRWEKDEERYTVHFTLPDGVKPADLKSVTYYVLFYDESEALPFLHEVGIGVSGDVKWAIDGDEIVGVFPEPYKRDGWKSYFWLSFETADGSSPESIYCFDPPLAPVIYGPTISTVDATTKGISVSWTNKDPHEQVFWTRCTISGDLLSEPIEEVLYGNPGQWDCEFRVPVRAGEYELRIEQYGFNFYNHAGDTRTIAIFDKGDIPPPIVIRSMPTYDGFKAHVRLPAFVDASQYQELYAQITPVEGGETRELTTRGWEYYFDVDGIDDEGLPFFAPLNKSLTENLQLDNGTEYFVRFGGISTDGVKGKPGGAIRVKPNAQAPLRRPVVSYNKFDPATGKMDVLLDIALLTHEEVTNLYAIVFTYTGPADDPEDFWPQQITNLNFTEEGDTFRASFNLEQWQDGRHYIIIFDFQTKEGAGGYSWMISNDETVPDEPPPPEKPIIRKSYYDAHSFTVEWESASPDQDYQDYFGYGFVVKDGHGNILMTQRTSTDAEPLVYRTDDPLPGGVYFAYVDALGWDYNASSVVRFDIPETKAPKPPKLDYAMCPKPWQMAVAWSTDEPKIEKYILRITALSSGSTTVKEFDGDTLKWVSQDPDVTYPPDIYPGDYTVTIESVRDGLPSGQSDKVAVTVKNFDLTPPKILKLTAQPGYKLLVEWQVMGQADFIEIAAQCGTTTTDRVKMPAGSMVLQLKGPGSYTVFGRNDYKHNLGPWGNSMNIYIPQET